MSIYPLPRPETTQTVPDLIRQLFAEFTELIHQYIELAKTEVREEGKLIAKAAIYGLVGLIVLQTTLVFLGNLFVMLLMIGGVNIVTSTFITMLVFLVVTAILIGFCVRQLRTAQTLIKPQR